MPSLPPPAAGRPSVAPQLRRDLLRMVIGVVVLDAIFITLKNRLVVDAWPEPRRLFFTGLWMVLTLAAILPPLASIRATRQRARYDRGPGAPRP